MSGGGEVRLLRQESGQESPRMPAWKREILERRKAKGGGSAPESGAGAAQQLTGSLKRDNGGKNYTITTASQHFSSNKETQAMEDARHENLVLQESLGPLEENPFIKLEKERRKRQDRDNTARPVQHILELYGSVPGIRTIRAENIIIIESDPDYFPDSGGGKTRSGWQQNGVDTYSSLNDLLDRRGSAVTEIRAKEVVIYDTTLSKSEENLSTLGRPDHEVSYESCEGQGRVSRILQKFDSNYGKLQKKSHSTENLLDLDSSASSRPSLWPKPQPDLVPKPRAGPSVSSQPPSPVFQGTWSSKAKSQPAASELGSSHQRPGAPQSVSSFRQRFEDGSIHGSASVPREEPDRGQSKIAREREWEGAEAPPKPKVPCSPETRRARAESPSSPVSSQVLHSLPEFEISPCPKPDLSQIPDGDVQARALANLRLQSRNSFTVIPKRRLSPLSGPGSQIPAGPVKSSPSHRAPEVSTSAVPTSLPPTILPTSLKRREEDLPEEKKVDKLARPSKPELSPPAATSPASPQTSEAPAPASPIPLSPPSIPPSPTFSLVPSDAPPSPLPSPAPAQPTSDQLPVTNIDEIEVEPPKRIPYPSPMVQRKKGNTFTVVPKRRVEPDAQPSSPEPPQEASSEAPPASTPNQAPYSQLGTLLKKRYPAVEDIEVIGGYLSLEKSCLSKTGSTGKKLKISFNESSLHSTYEYPSESSAWDSGEEEEQEAVEKLADEQPSMVGRIHIPRASFAGSPSHANNTNDLSNYIPKHSVDFSSWQEQKHEDNVHQEDASSQQTQITEEVMLTPADSSSLSDYSSEPALYF